MGNFTRWTTIVARRYPQSSEVLHKPEVRAKPKEIIYKLRRS